MKRFLRVILGQKNIYAKECYEGNFVGVDYSINEDLAGHLPEEWREFNKEYIPKYLANNPDKTKIAAGLACGAVWTLAKGVAVGDILLCPSGAGQYRVAEVVGEYYHASGAILQHRRPVKWLQIVVDRSSLSPELQSTLSSTSTICSISRRESVEELERYLAGYPVCAISSMDGDSPIEDLSEFAMEKHLEDFLVENWAQTDLGKTYDIYQEDGESAGQQYPTDTGPIDILAISKDKKQLLVVELKRGKASDAVVGQILRYMGFVQTELAEEGQTVRGVIIALKDDPRIRRALSITPSVEFYRYKIVFKLEK
jgi:restriction system protein